MERKAKIAKIAALRPRYNQYGIGSQGPAGSADNGKNIYLSVLLGIHLHLKGVGGGGPQGQVSDF